MNVVLKYLISNHNIRVLVIRNNHGGTRIVVLLKIVLGFGSTYGILVIDQEKVMCIYPIN